MIGCTQSFLSAVSGCTYDSTAGCLRDPLSNAPRYPYVANTRVTGWSGQWALGASGLACSRSTYDLLKGGTAITSGYKKGCWTDSAGAEHQLKPVSSEALPDVPPPPPPPP